MLAHDSFKIYGFRSSQEILGKKPNEGHFTPIKAFLKNSRLKLSFTRKHSQSAYTLGVLTQTTSWDRHWERDKKLK